MIPKTLVWLSTCVALAAMVAGCSQSGNGGGAGPDDQPSTPASATGSGGADLVILTPGDAADFGSHDDYKQSGVLSTRDGCVSIILDSGEEMLLFAPYGSEVQVEPPRIRIGDDAYDVGDEVHLVGQAKDVWQAVGASKPPAWRQCVGGRNDHEVMFVVGT